LIKEIRKKMIWTELIFSMVKQIITLYRVIYLLTVNRLSLDLQTYFSMDSYSFWLKNFSMFSFIRNAPFSMILR